MKSQKSSYTPTMGLITIFAPSVGAIGFVEAEPHVWGAVVSGMIYVVLLAMVWAFWRVHHVFDGVLTGFTVGYLLLSYIVMLDVVGVWNVFSLNSDSLVEAEMYLVFLFVGVILGVATMQKEPIFGQTENE